jgi:hypothetical protein
MNAKRAQLERETREQADKVTLILNRDDLIALESLLYDGRRAYTIRAQRLRAIIRNAALKGK